MLSITIRVDSSATQFHYIQISLNIISNVLKYVSNEFMSHTTISKKREKGKVKKSINCKVLSSLLRILRISLNLFQFKNTEVTFQDNYVLFV
jgi:hypothetical protein